MGANRIKVSRNVHGHILVGAVVGFSVHVSGRDDRTRTAVRKYKYAPVASRLPRQ